MAGMEERYKKYIEKAKSVIKTLDPKQNPNAAPEVSALKTQLQDKDKVAEKKYIEWVYLSCFLVFFNQVIDELEKETEKARAIREMEERLMASAFYDLGMKLHRGAVEDRLKNLSQGQSFLARQRQVPPHQIPDHGVFSSLHFSGQHPQGRLWRPGVLL